MNKVNTVDFPSTKQAFAMLYGCHVDTFRNWVKRLVDAQKVAFTYDDFKAKRLLPLSMRVEIAQHLGI